MKANNAGKTLYTIRVKIPGSVRVEYVKAFTPSQAVCVMRMRLNEQESKFAKLELVQ